MNRKQNIAGVLVAAVLLICFSSCQLFVNPMFKGLAKELDFSNASADEIAGNMDDMGADEQADALAALGEMEPEKINNLSAESKNDILSAQFSATVGGETLASATTAMSTLTSTDTSSMTQAEQEEFVENVATAITSIIDSIGAVDTKASTVILKSVIGAYVDPDDPEHPSETSFTFDETSGLDKATVGTAALSVMMSTVASTLDITSYLPSDDGNGNLQAPTVTDAEKEAVKELQKYLMPTSNSSTPTKTPEQILTTLAPITGISPTEDTTEYNALLVSIKAISAIGGVQSILGNIGNN